MKERLALAACLPGDHARATRIWSGMDACCR